MYKDTFKMINGDTVIEDGDFVLVNDREEYRQNLENRFAINKDEWFLNTQLGLDYSTVQGKGVTDLQIEAAIRECAMQDERTDCVNDIIVDRNNVARKAAIKFKVRDKEDSQYMEEVVDIE